MKLKEKIAIIIVAVFSSFLLFGLIASPSECILKVGNEAGFEMIGNYLAESDLSSNDVCPI
jgi:hypothetical protein